MADPRHHTTPAAGRHRRRVTRTISQSCPTRSRRRISRRRERHDRRPVGLSSGGASSYAWSAPRDQLRCWEPGAPDSLAHPTGATQDDGGAPAVLAENRNGWADHLDTDCGWGQAFWQVLLGPSCLWGHVFPRIVVVNSFPSAVIGDAAGERGVARDLPLSAGRWAKTPQFRGYPVGPGLSDGCALPTPTRPAPSAAT